MKHDDGCRLVIDYFTKMGYSAHPVKHRNITGSDVTIFDNDHAYTIEIKTLTKKPSGSWQALLVEPNRKTDDFVAVTHNGKILLIEPMEEYLRLCTPCGLRAFTKLKNLFKA